MIQKVKTTTIVLLLFVPMILLADSAKTLFQQANSAFETENYDLSISLYDSLLNVGLESPELYYNIGNAWYKKGEVPRAILYYERAKKLDPSNENIDYNLSLAQTRIADKIEPIPEFFLSRWWKASLVYFTEGQWVAINVISFSSFLVFAILFFVARKKSFKQLGFYLGIIFLIISLGTGFMGFRNNNFIHSHKSAIVFTPTINVKSSPTDNATTIFVIHQGTKVELIDQLKSWYRIKLANGSIGWIQENSFEKI